MYLNLESIKKVRHLNQEVANAGQEQSNGIAQISKAMNQLDEVTQINAASSEELSAQADSLVQVIQMLVEVVKGQNHKMANLNNGATLKAFNSGRKSSSKQADSIIEKVAG